jgi:hypothetical protein
MQNPIKERIVKFRGEIAQISESILTRIMQFRGEQGSCANSFNNGSYSVVSVRNFYFTWIMRTAVPQTIARLYPAMHQSMTTVTGVKSRRNNHQG